MKHYRLRGSRVAGLLMGLWLPAATAWAQAPAWMLALPAGISNTTAFKSATGVATDASGNVFVTGGFSGTVIFGSTTLSSAGDIAIYLAKYVPSTNTWAWAVRGGGTDFDIANGVAVSSTSVYITGQLTNNVNNLSACTFSNAATSSGTAPQAGAGGGPINPDIVLAKYTDNGTSATFGWSQVAGGTDQNADHNLAASGSSVYLTGHATNNAANATAMLFGGTGTTVGTVAVPGLGTSVDENILVARYVANGTSAGLAWPKTAGGTIGAYSTALALTGTRLYVLGQAYTPALFW